MAASIPSHIPDDVVRGWAVLAEQQRAHYEDLYRTGRWKHYYSEAQFRIRVRRAVELCDAWQAIIAAAGGPKHDDPEAVSSREAFRLADLSPPPLSMTSFRTRLAGLEPRYAGSARAAG
jgi:hypothetical protein